jgi:hypothetical protein
MAEIQFLGREVPEVPSGTLRSIWIIDGCVFVHPGRP